MLNAKMRLRRLVWLVQFFQFDLLLDQLIERMVVYQIILCQGHLQGHQLEVLSVLARFLVLVQVLNLDHWLRKRDLKYLL